MGVAEADAGLMGGVGTLNELLCESEVFADEDVDVLVGALGFLCVSHVHKTTLPRHLCQEKKWRSRWGSNPRRQDFRGPR